MSAAERSDAGLEEDESADAKIKRLANEINELETSLVGVTEGSTMWFKVKTSIKDRDIERLVLLEKKRCDDVVREYFEENPDVLEAVPECPICLEKMFDFNGTVRYVCCGKLVCRKCDAQGGVALNVCPLCRGHAPESFDEYLAIIKEKSDSGIAYAQADLGLKYLHGKDGVERDVEKALSLLMEAAEHDDLRAKEYLGDAYFHVIDDDEKARHWYEIAAAEGGISALCQLGTMMEYRQGFGGDERNKAEIFRLLTISSTLLEEIPSTSVIALSKFFFDTEPIMLHYLRPIVEGRSDAAVPGVLSNYALGITREAVRYYGEIAFTAPGYSPVPESLFWYRRREQPNV